MEKIWSYKCPERLSDKEKNIIIKKVFDAVVDNDMCEDIGEEIIDFVTSKGYVFEEEIED